MILSLNSLGSHFYLPKTHNPSNTDSLIIKIPSEFYLNSWCRFQKKIWFTVWFAILPTLNILSVKYKMTYLTQKYILYQQQQQQNAFIKHDLGWEVQAKQVNNMQNTNPETKHTGIDCGSIFDDAR